MIIAKQKYILVLVFLLFPAGFVSAAWLEPSAPPTDGNAAVPVYTEGPGQNINQSGTLHVDPSATNDFPFKVNASDTAVLGTGAVNGIQGSSPVTAIYGNLTSNGATGEKAIYGLAIDPNDFSGSFSGGLGLEVATGDIRFRFRGPGISWPRVVDDLPLAGLSVTNAGELRLYGHGAGINFFDQNLNSRLTVSEAGAVNVAAGGSLTVNASPVCLQNGAGCPTSVIPNLQQVTTAGNTSSNQILLTPGNNIEALRVITSNYSPLIIRNNANSADLFRVKETGDVGVGTGSPQAQLHVYGPVDLRLTLEDSDPAGSPYFDFRQGGAQRAYIRQTDNGAGADYLELSSQNFYFTGYGGATANLGLGTLPTAGRLHVVAAAGATIAHLDGSGAILDFGNYDSYASITSEDGGTGLRLKARGGNQPDLVVATSGRIGIGTYSPGAKLAVAPPASTEGIRVVSAADWSPLNIRNNADNADIFRVDQSGSLQAGNVPWARLSGFPPACPSGQFVTSIGSSLVCAGAAGGGTVVGGSGSANYVTKWSSGTTIGNSIIQDNGADVGIGTGPANLWAGSPDLKVGGALQAGKLFDDDNNYYADLNSGGNLGGDWAISGNLTVGASSVCRQNGTNCPLAPNLQAVTTAGNTSSNQIKLTPGSNVEALRVLSSNFSPLVIRNNGDTADLLRVDQSGILQAGNVPWARLSGWPAACPSGQFVTSVGSSLVCAGAAGGGTVVGGSGSANYVTKWSSGTAIGNSIIQDNGADVGIGTGPSNLWELSPDLNVGGALRAGKLFDDDVNYYADLNSAGRLGGSWEFTGDIGIGTAASNNIQGWARNLKVTGAVQAGKFFDDDNNYYADLNSGGNLGGNWAIGGNLTVGASSVCRLDGTNCPPTTTPNLQSVTTAGNTSSNQIKLTPGTNVEALRVFSSNFSPLVIRNNGDTADLFRVDQSGILLAGNVPWARLSGFPGACTSGQYVTAVGGNLTCSTPAAGIGGSGSANYVTKWSSGTAIGNSIIQDNGADVSIGGNLVVSGADNRIAGATQLVPLAVKTDAQGNGIVVECSQGNCSNSLTMAVVDANYAQIQVFSGGGFANLALQPNSITGNGGKVGIGTTAPNSQLHLKTYSGNSEIDIQSAGSPYWAVYQDDGTDELRFWNNNISGNKDSLKLKTDGSVNVMNKLVIDAGKDLCLGVNCKSSWGTNSSLREYKTIKNPPDDTEVVCTAGYVMVGIKNTPESQIICEKMW